MYLLACKNSVFFVVRRIIINKKWVAASKIYSETYRLRVRYFWGKVTNFNQSEAIENSGFLLLIGLNLRPLPENTVLYGYHWGGGGNSKKVNTHPKIPEIDLDFFRLL